MKTIHKSLILIISASLFYAVSAMAMDMHGDKIHMSKVDGHEFMYSMIDMDKKAKKAGMNHDMKGMYHLMVHVKKGEHFIDDGKTGFIVKGPDGNVQQVMAMKMSKGYGADIKMDKKGVYEIKVKTMKDGKAMVDHFKYEMK
jgi:hypothetical protein